MTDAIALPAQIGPYRNRILGLRVMLAGEHTDHPTSKPAPLFAIPMLQHTRRGEICYEPFSGSGSQHVAGELHGRLVYGLELAPEFVAVILERLSTMGLEPHQVEGA